MSLISINGMLLKKMMIAGANELNNQKQFVDSLNVFPVPDGDTGTNMSLTALAAARETEKNHSLNIGEIAKAAANGALRGARGNSGVITSQLFRGFARGLEGIESAGTKELAKAIDKGVKIAYQAVMKPKEGTILTVARACAESAAKLAEETDDIELFLEKVIEAGNAMLLQTTDMLPVLKQAGVVDAGGKGLMCILEGAYKNIHTKEEIKVDEPSKASNTDFAALVSVENESITFGYCTEFLIDIKNAEDSTMQKLKTFLSSIGDSIVCVNDEEVIKIHVHTDHPGLAIEKALTIGALSGLKIDNMRQQHTNKIDFSGGKQKEEKKEIKNEKISEKEIGFISISSGSGLSEIFKNLGVDQIIEGGQTMNPSTEDILNAIEKINAKNVIILPNNKNIFLAAEQAAKLTENKKVYVLPSKTIPEGISALISYAGNHETIGTALEAMKESMQGVITAMLTYAVRDTELGNKRIKRGDILGILNDEIVVVSKEIESAVEKLADKAITQESDMISIYYGSDVTNMDAEKIKEYIEKKYPDCEVELQCGNQPLYYYIISVE